MFDIKIKNLYKIFGANSKSDISYIQKGLTKSELKSKCNHVLALDNINIDIQSGQVQIIMGLSGSGKSTLLRHINRLIEPTSGEVLISNTNVTDLNYHDLIKFRQKNIAMVFQSFALLPHKNILDNIGFGLKLQSIDSKKIQEKSRYWLERVGLTDYAKSYPRNLSGGQQQRVGLARALAVDTPILLMDEAFSALDPLIRLDMQKMLLELQQELNKTIVFVTHDIDEALRLADSIAILKDGKLVQQGTSSDILNNPIDSYVKKFVATANVDSIKKSPDEEMDSKVASCELA